MENLLDTLEKQEQLYKKLLELSTRKTPIIIKGDITALQAITDEEQLVVDDINHLEKTREEVMQDIANVINKDVNTLKLIHLIEMLKNQPSEQKRLAQVNDKLKETTKQMKRVNEQNRELIENALEMVSFDLNLLKGLKTAPETANYNQQATNTGDYYGGNITGSFDAKQ